MAIRYDLLKGGDSPIASKNPKAPKTAKKEKSNDRETKRSEPPAKKIIPFAETPAHPDRDDEAVRDLIKQLHNAIGFLEQGRHAAALNLLRRIVSSVRPARL